MDLRIETTRILERAMGGIAPDRKECIYLLDLPENSLDASVLKSVADWTSRQRYHNRGIIQAQIGLESHPCPGDCGFCVFGVTHTTAEAQCLPLDEVIRRAIDFTQNGDLYALFLMTMHDFDFNRLLRTIEAVRGVIPTQTRLVVNIGDFDEVQAATLRQCGVAGAYHVARLREGIDTGLDPEDRRETIEGILKAGMDWYTCCEPIGPEHSSQELVDQFLMGTGLGCYQNAAMRRVAVIGSRLANRGQISNRRLAQIVAVITLSSLGHDATTNISVHEPNLLGLTAGANAITAETGANPRDESQDTAQGRGLDIAMCKDMLVDSGFDQLLLGDGTTKAIGFQG